MKILILGSGAREHAIAWACSKSSRITGLFVAPGNAGCDDVGVSVGDLDPLNCPDVVAFCRENKIDIVFIGSEVFLEAGIADALQKEKILHVGPDKYRAQLESSKVFSKQFMVRNNLPTAKSEEFYDYSSFETYIKNLKTKFVVKKSGLAAGKGVLETENHEEALAFAKPFFQNDKVLVEEFLTGFEISVFVLSDGKNYKILPPCADFKKAYDGDKGPNTGGMGAICPVPTVTPEIWNEALTKAIKPTMEALNAEGLNYPGIIFLGLMITSQGAQILEYNARFGDPETQSVLCLIKNDFLDIAEAMAKGTLDQITLEISNQVALGVVVAAEGYPGDYKKNVLVESLPRDAKNQFKLFHASTKKNSENKLLTTGGRCFSCVGLGDNLIEAQKNAYRGAEQVEFQGAWFRTDIGKKFFKDFKK